MPYAMLVCQLYRSLSEQISVLIKRALSTDFDDNYFFTLRQSTYQKKKKNCIPIKIDKFQTCTATFAIEHFQLPHPYL